MASAEITPTAGDSLTKLARQAYLMVQKPSSISYVHFFHNSEEYKFRTHWSMGTYKDLYPNLYLEILRG